MNQKTFEVDETERKSLTDLLDILLTIQKKSELKKYCRSIIITQGALADLILGCACEVIPPWQHRRHHRDFVPDQLELTSSVVAWAK